MCHPVYFFTLTLFRNGLTKFLMEDVVKTHPIVITQNFIPNPYTSNPHSIENLTTDGLAKLFAYGSYVRARLEHNGTSINSVLGIELDKYPYARKARLPDGDSHIFRSYVFGPSGFWTMAQLRYAAKFDPFLSLDCAPRPPPWRNPRKGRDQILPSGNLDHRPS